MMTMIVWNIVETREMKKRDACDQGQDLCHDVYFVLCNIKRPFPMAKMCFKNLPGLKSLEKP